MNPNLRRLHNGADDVLPLPVDSFNDLSTDGKLNLAENLISSGVYHYALLLIEKHIRA